MLCYPCHSYHTFIPSFLRKSDAENNPSIISTSIHQIYFYPCWIHFYTVRSALLLSLLYSFSFPLASHWIVHQNSFTLVYKYPAFLPELSFSSTISTSTLLSTFEQAQQHCLSKSILLRPSSADLLLVLFKFTSSITSRSGLTLNLSSKGIYSTEYFFACCFFSPLDADRVLQKVLERPNKIC